MHEDFFHDAAEDYRASYEHHPVEDMEPEADYDPPPSHQWRAIRAEGAAMSRIFQFIIDPLELKR